MKILAEKDNPKLFRIQFDDETLSEDKYNKTWANWHLNQHMYKNNENTDPPFNLKCL